MSKYSSVKNYKINEEKLQKKLLNNIKVFRRKKKKKSKNMVINDRKIYQKMINESLLSIEKLL